MLGFANINRKRQQVLPWHEPIFCMYQIIVIFSNFKLKIFAGSN